MESQNFELANAHSVSVSANYGARSTPAAVVVRNACKSYPGSGEVVKGLNLTVPQGTIYSLLGCSGCGKSTTLACIVGLDKFTSGDVWIFGMRPGTIELGIPGRNVGYMPQDYSLYNEFTIMETFKYFGTLNGMDKEEILFELSFFTDLLHLPKYSSRLEDLSGGQRRRISFAISLQHKAALVMLDEPTVGVDALVRERIWEYLVDLTLTKKTTVIITTHYIEEARHSHTVGIMGNGRLIAEDSPSALMETFGTHSLEAVVLQLARNNNDHIGTFYRSSESIGLPQMAFLPSKISVTSDTLRRLRALTFKNTTVAMRSLMLLFILITVPGLSLLSYFIALGNNLTYINFGAVNDEVITLNGSCQSFNFSDGTCSLEHFSCKYLQYLSPPVFNLQEFQSKEEAEEAVRLGHIMGFVYLPPDFSWYFYERAVSGIQADPNIFNESNIVARLDQSSTITARVLEVELLLAFQKFVRGLLTDCDYDPSKANYSLEYKEPIFGDANTVSFRDYIIPSAFVGAIFFWPIVSSGILFVSEKRDGTIERSMVSGIHMWEILLAYTFPEFFIAVFRMLIIYVMAVFIFKVEIVGSIWLIFLLGLITSYMGVACGFFFGSFCREELEIALLAMALFIPNMFLSGMHWPAEGMPVWLQKISTALPCTLAGETMRSITGRGWGFWHPHVWPGFAVTFGYMMLFFMLSIAVVWLKSRRVL